jgi:parvulin-like peptidyl-prolyl isomerase
MRRTRLFILVSLAVLLAACGQPVTPTPSPTPSPIPPTATTAPAPSPTSPAATAATPGGVDVAMKLVKIPDQKNVAVVEGEEISTTAYQQELNRALYMVTSQYGVDWNDPKNQAPLPALQQQVLDQMIERVTLRQLASKEGVSIDSQNVETETVALQGRVQASGQYADWATFLKENSLTDESVRSLIADNLLSDAMNKRHAAPTSAEQVHASHILVATQETGQEVLDKLAKGEAFADLAAQYSTDTGSKDQGGDLGWFPRGVMVPAFEQAAFSLEPGKVSQLVQTDYGYHIILVQAKEVREIDPSLYQQVQQQFFQTWIKEQQATMKMERLYTFAPPK